MRRRRRMSFAKRVMAVSPNQVMMSVTPLRCDGDYGKQLFSGGNANLTCMLKTELAAIMAVPPSTDDTSIVLIKNKKLQLHMSNMESTNVLVQIYHYRTKRDENLGPGSIISAGIQDLYGTSTYDVNTYGVTPFQSAIFCKTFHVQKIIALELGAGRSHIHTVKWNINKILDKSVLTETDSDTTSMAGWTQGIFIIARGEPVNNAVETPGHSDVTPSATALDCVVSAKTTFVYGSTNVKSLQMTYTIPTTGITAEQMNEATGGVTSVTEA